jgi:spore photoproduct lyase
VKHKLKEVWVDRNVENNPLTLNILKNLPDVRIRHTDDPRQPVNETCGSPTPISKGKQTLLITQNKGEFLKRCPGTKNYTCCGYYFLNTIANCDLDCSYCILQSYFRSDPVIKIFVNFSSMFTELDQKLSTGSFFRIGTGELTDSLSLDHITGFSKQLVRYFGKKRNAVLELKTKTDKISNLLDIDEPENTIISWSLNPPRVVQEEEIGAVPLQQRIDAAKACISNGYLVGFHFDPLIRYPEWEEDYREVVKLLFHNIEPRKIVWISLGSLRFMPQLKPIIEKRFPETAIIYDEFVPGLDNKLRYFKPLRVEMYQKMLSWIREFSQDVVVYFCMESKDVWQKVFGWHPENLPSILDNRAREMFDL